MIFNNVFKDFEHCAASVRIVLISVAVVSEMAACLMKLELEQIIVQNQNRNLHLLKK